MEILEKLRNKYKKLKEESNNIYSKIRILEKKEAISKFTVGDCYLNTTWNTLIKIVSISDSYIYYMYLDDAVISRDNSYIFDIEGWEKITSEQFKDAYLAVTKDIQDPDLNVKEESNWDIAFKSILESVNNEK